MTLNKKYIIFIKLVIGIAISVMLVFWVHATIGWRSVYDLIVQISFWSILTIFAAIVLSHILRAIRLMVCYRNLNVNFSETAGIAFIHNCLNFWLPMRLGEIALPLLSKYGLGVGYKASTLTLVFIRLLDIHVLLVLVTYFGARSLFEGHFQWLIIVCLVGLPIVLVSQRYWIKKIPFLRELHDITGSAVYWSVNYTLTAAAWLTKLGALTYLALSLSGINVNHIWLAIIMADASSISPITGLANAGTFEAGFVIPLQLLGYDQSTMLSVAVAVHVILGFVSLLMGALGILFLMNRNRRDAPAQPGI